MAQLFPTIQEVLNFKVKPTEGELHLLKFLETHLDNSFEVFFNPYMNGDRPDIVLVRKGYGVMIIEVKDYNLDSYELDERKHWKVKGQDYIIKSPINQVWKYKDNLFELHIEGLLEKKIKDIRNFNIVSCAIYFHNASFSEIEDLLIKPFEEDRRYQNFLKYSIDFLSRDSLNENSLNKILRKRYLKADKLSFLFTDDIYKSFKRFLKPSVHLIADGRDFSYSPKQWELIYESNKKQQRIKGVVGSGKTTILAARAVQSYKRTKGKVLILTYNITLKNYIHDKISEVREEFPWEAFTISNYHQFITMELNNLGIPVEVPSDFEFFTEEKKNDFFEKTYYSNVELFKKHKLDIQKFGAILIDEIQDYKRPWMDIIKDCFLIENGEYILFGDVKQNIYNNQLIGKDIATNVLGVTELKRCFRSDFKIKDLAIEYQKDFFRDKYEIDSFNEKGQTLEIKFERDQQGSINYVYMPNADSIITLYNIIYQNAINKNIPPNDITVLANSISLLKKFESFYRYSSNERTATMFETTEIVYRMGMNYLKDSRPEWLIRGIELIKRDKDKSESRGFNQLSTLFTVYNLYLNYPDRFKNKLNFYCEKFKTSCEDFIEYMTLFRNEIHVFEEEYNDAKQKKMFKLIRDNKKLHFYMNTGTIKMSTIHSFKGWESEMLFLILEKKNSKMEISFDEILYTGITRCRSNLVLINFGNEEYHDKLKIMIDKVK